MKPDEIKNIVRDKYENIAGFEGNNKASCCSSSCCCTGEDITAFNENYGERPGYISEADLGLGCGIPTDFAGIKQGDHVLDLGSGAGNDCFVARALVGEKGRVTGIDFTRKMVEKARENCQKLGYNNVEFVEGDIEAMPFEDNSFDVVLSNCVLNLVPDKAKAFSEIYRVLKPGGHFCISDVVLKGQLSEKTRHNAELYTGCISGACSIEEYIGIISKTGFRDITVHKQRKISIPPEIEFEMESQSLNDEINGDGKGIFSITVSAIK